MNNERTQKIVQDIEDGRYDQKSLEALYKNAEEEMKKPNISEERIQNCKIIQLAAKDGLRDLGDKREYTKRFIKPIREKVEEHTYQIAIENNCLDFKDTYRVRNGVKVGGDMIRGDVVAQYYFSYRHPTWKKSTSFAVTQESENSGVIYTVRLHTQSREEMFKTIYIEEAIEIFKNDINGAD